MAKIGDHCTYEHQKRAFQPWKLHRVVFIVGPIASSILVSAEVSQLPVRPLPSV